MFSAAGFPVADGFSDDVLNRLRQMPLTIDPTDQLRALWKRLFDKRR